VPSQRFSILGAFDRSRSQAGQCAARLFAANATLYPLARTSARHIPVQQGGSMDDFVRTALAFIGAHSDWATAIVFGTAFGESFVFLYLLFPGTSMLIAAGALIAAGSLPYQPVLAAAVTGLVLGDATTFWIGRRLGGAVERIWPFTRNPELLAGGIRFFAGHGGKSVFICRFFGPIRGVVPLAAGIMRMPSDRFWLANIGSAIVWAPILLFAGNLLGNIGERLIGWANFLVLAVGAILLFGAVSLGVVLFKLRGRR
jgi:membrane protein DedA with SNARE-associated domain